MGERVEVSRIKALLRTSLTGQVTRSSARTPSLEHAAHPWRVSAYQSACHINVSQVPPSSTSHQHLFGIPLIISTAFTNHSGCPCRVLFQRESGSPVKGEGRFVTGTSRSVFTKFPRWVSMVLSSLFSSQTSSIRLHAYAFRNRRRNLCKEWDKTWM